MKLPADRQGKVRLTAAPVWAEQLAEKIVPDESLVLLQKTVYSLVEVIG